MRALILGASGGIGQALVAALNAQGMEVTGLTRSGDGLDLTDEGAVRRIAQTLTGPYDMIFNATGALVIRGHQPEKTIRSISTQAMAAQFALNATGVALALQAFSPLLPRKGRSVFASLSARVGSIGDNRLGGWISYRAAKAAQNQILRTASIEIARTRPEAIIVALHPGTVETSLSAQFAKNHPTISADQSAAALLDVISDLTPLDTGSFWDWKGKRVEW